MKMVAITQMIGWILYTLYLLWVFGIAAEVTDNINFESPIVIWSCATALILMMIVATILYMCNMCTTKILGFLLIIGCIGLISIFAYQYIAISETYTYISGKVLNANKILTYQYGLNSEEIGRKLGINHNKYFDRQQPKQLQEIWELLMSNPRDTKNIIHDLIGDLHDEEDVYYNLLWYLCLSENPFGNNLLRKDINYVLSLSLTELQELCGNNYVGLKDRASLLFTALSGEIIPNVSYSLERYAEIKQYEPEIIYNLTFCQPLFGIYRMINTDDRTYSIVPPYIYLAKQKKLPVEILFNSITINDCDNVIQEFGLLPPSIINSDTYRCMTPEQKLFFVRNDLSCYHNVINRPSNTVPPPSLEGKDINEIITLISKYTNAELIVAYDPRGYWSSRLELLRLIKDDIVGTPKWAFSNAFCTNDATINILTGELHGTINKDDLEDPILSYGTHKKYQCYQASELEAAFREYDQVFMFHVPDWTHDTTSHPNRTNQMKEFPLESIKQLNELLAKVRQPNENITNLINKINTGIKSLNSANMKIQLLRKQFEEFTSLQKDIITKYLAWMFMYSMWMRFWKGPGFPWPITKVNVTRSMTRNKEQRTSPEERDEHIFIQEAVRTLLIESFENDFTLSTWISNLPTIYYDFDTKEAKCASYPIKDVLDKIALGDYCMGFGSDTILKTSYYYIINLLNNSEGPSFDSFINKMLPIISDLEYRVVTTQLESSVSQNNFRKTILHRRKQSLEATIPIQPGFHPHYYQNNFHTA